MLHEILDASCAVRKSKHSMPIGVYKRTEHQKEILRMWGRIHADKIRLKKKNCEVCGKEFKPVHGNSAKRHCSRECARKNLPKKGIFKDCMECGKSIYVMQCLKDTVKYCSKKCKIEASRIPESFLELKCKYCGSFYKVERSHVKWRGSSFCSAVCMNKFKRTKYFKARKVKSTSNATLKRMLWLYFSKYIRNRDGGVCISCGKKGQIRDMDAGHYIPKTAGLSIYFDERNVNCQCTYCNRFMHGNLSKYAIALRKKYGENILEELDEKRKEKIQIHNDEYIEKISFYKFLLFRRNKQIDGVA